VRTKHFFVTLIRSSADIDWEDKQQKTGSRKIANLQIVSRYLKPIRGHDLTAWLRPSGGGWLVFSEMTGQLMRKRHNINHSSARYGASLE
jgi:hypothetical protein